MQASNAFPLRQITVCVCVCVCVFDRYTLPDQEFFPF